MKLTFTNKEEYLAYRSNWKAEYKQLSQDIRDLKFCRSFPMANRFQNPKNVERYREIEKRLFNNPNTCVEWKIEQYRNKATAMLLELKEAKQKAQDQYLVAKSEQRETVLA
jgi:hypothetical protein